MRSASSSGEAGFSGYWGEFSPALSLTFLAFSLSLFFSLSFFFLSAASCCYSCTYTRIYIYPHKNRNVIVLLVLLSLTCTRMSRSSQQAMYRTSATIHCTSYGYAVCCTILQESQHLYIYGFVDLCIAPRPHLLLLFLGSVTFIVPVLDLLLYHLQNARIYSIRSNK